MNDAIEWPGAFEIPDAKLTRYLLDVDGKKPDHARWFIAQGFSPDESSDLAKALYHHAIQSHFTKIESDEFGVRYVFEAPLNPSLNDGRRIKTSHRVRSIWMMRHADRTKTARFVTAYSIGSREP